MEYEKLMEPIPIPDTEIDLLQEAYEIKLLVNNLCYTSQESFMNIVLSIYNKIKDLISGIALTFRKKVYRHFNTLKQTELEEFLASNHHFLYLINKANYNDLRNIKVPYPEGMISTYLDVTSKVVNCLNSFDMLNRSKSFLTICTNIYEGVKNKGYRSEMPELQKQMVETEDIKSLFQSYVRCFTKKKLSTKLDFGKLFLNMQEFKSVLSLFEENDKHQFQVKKIYRFINDGDRLIKLCISLLEKDNTIRSSITREDLISISNACMFLAKTIDMYGTTITDYHTLEHNFVEVLKVLKKK